MAKTSHIKNANGITLRSTLDRILEMMPPQSQAMYRRSLAGTEQFRLNFRAADKGLPICSECGNNCNIAERHEVAGLSRCCFAPIEQDLGAES